MRPRGSRRHASVRTRAAGPCGGARSTPRRPDSPRLLGDETLRCLLTPDAGGRVLRVRLHDQAVDLGLAIGGEEALDRFSDDVGAGPPRARPVRVEALEELVGELHQGLGASHRHMVAIWGSKPAYAIAYARTWRWWTRRRSTSARACAPCARR